MLVWPKNFYIFGLSLKTAGAEWKLRQKRSAAADQERAFTALIAKLSATTFWREAGIEPQMSYARFKARVPLQTYVQIEPAIQRMRAGQADVLWPGTCTLFAATSGTVTGQPKILPITEEMLVHFRRGGRDALLYYTVRAKNAGVFYGRQLLVGSSSVSAVVEETASTKAYAANLSAILTLVLPAWAEKHLFEPGTAIAALPDWEKKIAAIADRSYQCDLSLIGGLPSWLVEFTRKMRARYRKNGAEPAALQSLWPNLECVVHSGTPVTPHLNELHVSFGPDIAFHEIYVAAESFVAAQDIGTPGSGLRLMAHLGVFFEFLPLADYNPEWREQSGAKALSLSEVQTGVDYVVIVTTPAGLARYVLGDVVRFVSSLPPRVIYVGRIDLQLNAFNEHVMEKDVTDALVYVCNRHQWLIVNFHVAPLMIAGELTGQKRGRHEWWLELQPGTVETPTGPQIAAELDPLLQRANPEYAARRKANILETPVVRLVMPGVFEHWMRFRGKWGGQHKLPRCRSDREIADELAQITHFARD
jgi:hypothetical protein